MVSFMWLDHDDSTKVFWVPREPWPSVPLHKQGRHDVCCGRIDCRGLISSSVSHALCVVGFFSFCFLFFLLSILLFTGKIAQRVKMENLLIFPLTAELLLWLSAAWWLDLGLMVSVYGHVEAKGATVVRQRHAVMSSRTSCRMYGTYLGHI